MAVTLAVVLKVVMVGRRDSCFAARVAGIVCAFFSLTSCVSQDYIEIYDLPSEGWTRSSSIVFTYRPYSVDPQSVGFYSGTRPGDDWIDITVRYSDEFPYADLPLEVKGVTPDKKFWVDTVDFALGERTEDGTFQWAGRRNSNHYDITRRYRSGIMYDFPLQEYAVSIRQLTEQDTLRGVLSVGITASGARAMNIR